jgi:hypothetical protein
MKLINLQTIEEYALNEYMYLQNDNFDIYKASSLHSLFIIKNYGGYLEIQPSAQETEPMTEREFEKLSDYGYVFIFIIDEDDENTKSSRDNFLVHAHKNRSKVKYYNFENNEVSENSIKRRMEEISSSAFRKLTVRYPK